MLLCFSVINKDFEDYYYYKLTYNDILHYQAAYECFDKAGKKLFPG